MGDKIKLALIGAGQWGKNLARVFSKLNILKTICESSEEILLIKGSKYPEVYTTPSFDEVLACADINAIAIATPAEKHYSMAKKALLASKHVFVEKPLSIPTEEGEDLIRVANQRGKILFAN